MMRPFPRVKMPDELVTMPRDVWMLKALNRTKRRGEMYQGTVPAHVKAQRRAKNKVARASRRRNR